MSDSRIAIARQLCERVVFGADTDALIAADRELDAVEAELALVRGQIVHARFLETREADPRELPWFEQAAALYRALGDAKGVAEALFWIGCFHQVVRDDGATALPSFERARELATETGDQRILSYALRHLALVDHAAGRLDSARELLEESTRLRRALEFWPGVAANLVGLIHIAATEGRREDALALLEEADRIANDCGADRVIGHLAEARSRVDELG